MKKNKNDYSVIIFDLGNTLIRFDHNISALKLAGLSPLGHKKIYDTFFDSGMTRAFEKGRLSPRGFHKEVSRNLGLDISFEKFVPIWNDIFWEDKGSCRLARKLKKSYKLFLLSNINKLHFEHIKKKFGIIGIFDELVLSYLVGSMKPEKKIFKEALRRAGKDRKKVLYIDDREDLIKEALSLGIDSIHYEGADKLEAELAKREIFC